MSYNDELYHWGIKGMKWGIRRFQNKDGTLTALGKKRKRDNDNDDVESKPKSVKDMSDTELRAKINRLSMEKQLMDLDRQVNGIKPAEASRGEKFVSSFKKDFMPALTNVGKNLISGYIEKKGKELLGLSSVDELDSLRKTANKLGLEKQIEDLKKALSGEDKKVSILDMSKLDQYSDDQIANANKRQNNIKNLLKNWDEFSTTPFRDFYGNDFSYAESVSRGEGAVQEALRKMEERNNSKKSESSSSGTGVKSAPAQKTSNESKSARPSLSDIANSGYRMKNTDYIENRGYDYGFKFTNRTSRAVGKLADSGYKMSSLETLSGEKKTNLGRTHLSDIIDSGWKMTSLDDIERRGYRK